jgi:protoporphyrin/coproporphyrin ferrochelatase
VQDLKHDVVGYQVAGREIVCHSSSKSGAGRDLNPQQLPRRQVSDGEMGRNSAALSAFARRRWADQKDAHSGAFRRPVGGNCEDCKMRPYDAVLIVSFGGPDGPDDVMPFLQNVTAGRGVPPERLAEVAEHYQHVGGVSPINGQNRALLAAVRADFTEHGVGLPVYWGNRHWAPTLTDVLGQMRDDGITHAIALLTSAYASYSGCRQYLDAIERARGEIGAGAPTVDRLRQYFNHPGFIEPMVDGVEAALRELPDEYRADAPLAFVAHSIPSAMEATSGPLGNAYTAQLLEAARLVSVDVGGEHRATVSFCSRSGSPATPWLEPDILDRLSELAAEGVRAVVVVPVGFVSDHMEVVYDLDTEAAAKAADLGLRFVRSATVGTDPRFVAMVRELVLERAADGARRSEGSFGPAHDVCPIDCCKPAGGGR